MTFADQHNIVYIEDDQEMIELVAMILSRRGYEVKGMQSGRAGLDFVLAEKPDLVLLDLMIPDIDGWDIFQQIRSRPDTGSIPIIVITAKTQPIDRVLGLKIAKANDYISKPFHPKDLLDSIDRVLGSIPAQ